MRIYIIVNEGEVIGAYCRLIDANKHYDNLVKLGSEPNMFVEELIGE